MAWEWHEVPALVERFGPEAVGRLYATRCRGALTAAEGAPHAARDVRATSPSVDRLFRVMQAYYRNVWGRPDAGWWDGDPTSAPA